MAGVHLTRIYTRTGDDGTTGLGDFSRVPKTHVRIAAYADVDECNAALGTVLALAAPPENIRGVLTTIQNDLFDLGADLCNPVTDDNQRTALRVSDTYVSRLESWCDEHNADLPALNSFVLPGGTPAAALLHVARTICRRAERSTWALLEQEGEKTNPITATYLNRLSDLLFILARRCNPDGDVTWVPGAAR